MKGLNLAHFRLIPSNCNTTLQCNDFIAYRTQVSRMTLLQDNLACSVGGSVCMCVCRFVVICYHVLIRQTAAPESLGRQTAECVTPGFRFRVLGLNLLSAPPFFLDACLLCFPSDEGRPRQPKTHE